MGEFRMPSLGADMTEGTLLLWRVKPGDRVKRGDIIAEVATDKGDIEVEVFEDGVVEELLVPEGTEVPVGQVLARIAGEGTSSPAPPAPESKPESKPSSARVKASPVARRLAAERDIDLAEVRGSGPGGAITREDVERFAPVATTTPPEQARPPSATRLRKAIAAAMARSNREIPHYYLDTRIDMNKALDRLAEDNRSLPLEERLLPVVLLLKAVALALRDVPELNGYWLDDALKQEEAIHIGFAISLRQGGLVIPALHDVDRKSLPEIMAALRELIPRARAGRLRSSEMTDATITVTNLGDLGVETVHGVIYPPQVALVGFGKIRDRAWAENGMVGVRPIVSASLAADHRATDGRRGAQFLDALDRHLQEPQEL
jgi:pyruvate dehydrogenase E2 component (dihydrolipoamide acetyltransferase)